MPSYESSPAMPVPAEEPFEYKLLTAHNRTDSSFKSDGALRTEYLRRTDELIRQMTEGVPYTDQETGETTIERPDAVIFLDKSARPLSWLTKEMWPKYAADAEGNVPKMPGFYFANIDREQWVNQLDPQGVGTVNVDNVDPTIIRSLRSIFVSPTHKKEGLTPDIDTAPTVLDGKKLLIVDEVHTSGRTLIYAKKFFGKAFPDAKIAGTYWMSGMATVGTTGMANADLPVWYKEDSPTGRGVNNRNERVSQKSNSQTQKLGAWFLSTRFQHPDPRSLQLRKELDHLAHDPDVVFIPSRQRKEADEDERLLRFNPGLSMQEIFVRTRAQSEEKK